MMDRCKLKVVILICVLALIILAIYRTWWLGAERIATDNAYIQGEVTTVSVEVTGRVLEVLIADNQSVQQGQLLARLDDSDYRTRVQQAQAALAVSEAALANNLARSELQQLKVNESAAYMDKASADNELQQSELQRYASLVKSGAVSQSLHATQRSKAKEGSATLAAAEFQLAGARQQLKALAAEHLQLEAQRQQAEAALALSQSALAHTRIVAPVSGIVANRALQQGKFVTAGSGVLAIVPVDNLWLVANYKETQLSAVQPGQVVKVRLDMFPSQPFDGRVLSIAPSTGTQFSLLPPDNASGNFIKVVQRLPVKIELQIPAALQGRLVPGLSAQATIETGAL